MIKSPKDLTYTLCLMGFDSFESTIGLLGVAISSKINPIHNPNCKSIISWRYLCTLNIYNNYHFWHPHFYLQRSIFPHKCPFGIVKRNPTHNLNRLNTRFSVSSSTYFSKSRRNQQQRSVLFTHHYETPSFLHFPSFITHETFHDTKWFLQCD